VEGGRGFWRSIVGDGRSVFRVNSTSGGLRLLAASPEDRVVAATAPSAPAGSASEAAATSSPAAGAGAEPAEAEAEGAGAEAEESSAAQSVESWNPEETADASGDVAEEEELAVLQALERGEIGVDEAAERLDRSRR
jgi:hypothetical protein